MTDDTSPRPDVPREASHASGDDLETCFQDPRFDSKNSLMDLTREDLDFILASNEGLLKVLMQFCVLARGVSFINLIDSETGRYNFGGIFACDWILAKMGYEFDPETGEYEQREGKVHIPRLSRAGIADARRYKEMRAKNYQ